MHCTSWDKIEGREVRCGAEAQAIIHWPGREPVAKCLRHGRALQAFATQQRVYVTVDPLPSALESRGQA